MVGSGSEQTVVDGAGTVKCSFNYTAPAVWQLCDGRTSVAEMVEAVAVLCDEPWAVARHDIEQALRRMGDEGLLAPGSDDLTDHPTATWGRAEHVLYRTTGEGVHLLGTNDTFVATAARARLIRRRSGARVP